MRIALLPWGDVIEDFLDPIGVSLEAFRDEMSGGWLFGYIDALRTAGIETVLFCVSAQVQRVTHWTHRPTGAPLCMLPGRRGRSPYRATPLRHLARELARYDCAAMLCQEYEYPRFDCCSALGLLTGIPVFATFQGGDFQSRRVERLFRRWSLRTCAGLIIGSEDERQRVQRNYGIHPDRMAPIFNPVDLDVWYPEERAEARKALGIPQDARVAAWHGRIDIANKGLDLLIEAWRAIPEGLLLLAGDGRDSTALESLLQTTERVQWRSGYSLDRNAMRRYLSAADVYIFPSRHEGFAVAPLEAMACGLPVVATDSPVMRELGATIVPQNDSYRLSQTVAALLQAPDRCQQLGRQARQRIETDFAPTSVGARLHRFITESIPPARHQLYRPA